MILNINGDIVFSQNDFHEQVAHYFDVANFYGYNSDALYDLLTGGVDRPLHLLWHGSELAHKRIGDDFDLIIKVFDLVIEFDKLIRKNSNDIFSYELM